jgi:hypothetical protein
MQPAAIIAQDLQLETMLKDLIVVHEWLLVDEENYNRYSEGSSQYKEAVEAMQEWLDASASVRHESRGQIQATVAVLLNFFGTFKLQPTHQGNRFNLEQSIDNPLSIAINGGQYSVVTALISAKAPFNEAMLQFAINSNNTNLLDHMMNGIAALPSEDRRIHDEVLANVIAYNCTATPNRPALSPEMAEKLVNQLPGRLLSAVLAKAAEERAMNILTAILEHPCMNAAFLVNQNYSLTVRTLSILNFAETMHDQEMVRLIQNTLLKDAYQTLIFSTETDTSLLSQFTVVTPAELATYVLSRAQGLPQEPDSISQIQAELSRLTTAGHPLRYFLSGYITNSTLNKLINDLKDELRKRVPVENQATSSTATFVAPRATPAVTSKMTPAEMITARKELEGLINRI